MREAWKSGPGCAVMQHYIGVTSVGKPGGCKCVKSSGMLEGSPECVGVCREFTMCAGKHKKCADIAGMVRRVQKCAGVRWSNTSLGMCREVESVRNEKNPGCQGSAEYWVYHRDKADPRSVVVGFSQP